MVPKELFLASSFLDAPRVNGVGQFLVEQWGNEASTREQYYLIVDGQNAAWTNGKTGLGDIHCE
jgi:hypothetical protein